MTRAPINKSSLAHQRSQLRLFQRFLPSLDLKRQQLLTEQKDAQRQLADVELESEELARSLPGLMEPLGAYEIDLHGLVTIDSVVIEEENIVGARLPVAREVKFTTATYAMLGKPFWVDFLVEYLQRSCILRVHLQVHRERTARLNQQVRKITQRVNLFEKVLIPKAQENINPDYSSGGVFGSQHSRDRRVALSSALMRGDQRTPPPFPQRACRRFGE